MTGHCPILSGRSTFGGGEVVSSKQHIHSFVPFSRNKALTPVPPSPRRWINEKEAFKDQTHSTYIHPVVYQDPYKSVKSTARLFTDYPQIAAHTRRIWFNGIYQFDTNKYIFQVLRNAVNIQTTAIPWTAVRYGGQEEWQQLMSFPRLTSLEFLTVGLTSSQIKIERNLTDNGVLQPGNGLDFSGLRRFKIFGDSNLMPLTDEDLFFISRTAVNLEEIHITGATSVTIKGIFIIYLLFLTHYQ